MLTREKDLRDVGRRIMAENNTNQCEKKTNGIKLIIISPFFLYLKSPSPR